MPPELSLIQTVIDLLQAGGLLLALVIALVGAMKRWYVFRPEFDDERADKDEWKQLYLEAVALAGHATATAEKLADK